MKIIIDQILMMAILMMVGYGLRKLGYFEAVVTRDISKFLLRFVIPMTIIEAFMVPFDIDIIKEMTLMGILTVILTLLLIYLGSIFYKEEHAVEKYATIFTNKGFIGIPIMSALYGKEAIAILTPMIFVGHVFMWTYGINLLSKEKKQVSLKQIFINPSFIGLMIGLGLFILPINYPYPLVKSVSSLTSLNTPLAMLVLGVYLANTNLIDMFKDKMSYYVSFIRLILTPILTIFLVKYLPVDILIKNVIVISMAVPAASNTAMFAQMTNQDPGYGAQIVSKTTIFSAITMPFIIWLMDILL